MGKDWMEESVKSKLELLEILSEADEDMEIPISKVKAKNIEVIEWKYDYTRYTLLRKTQKGYNGYNRLWRELLWNQKKI